mgnify:CR=1 FL=1
MPYNKAVEEMKAFAKKAYAKAGIEAYEKNCKAIDLASEKLTKIADQGCSARCARPCRQIRAVRAGSRTLRCGYGPSPHPTSALLPYLHNLRMRLRSLGMCFCSNLWV